LTIEYPFECGLTAATVSGVERDDAGLRGIFRRGTGGIGGSKACEAV